MTYINLRLFVSKRLRGCSAGKGFMPFHKNVRPMIYRLDHYLREGMKPSPASMPIAQSFAQRFLHFCVKT